MLKYLFYLSIASLFYSVELRSAESLIQGKIVIKANQKPLSGCSIYNYTQNIGTVSDKNGYFSITSSPNDEVQIRYLGFQMYTLDLSQPKDTFFVEMEYSVRELRSVRIKGAPNARNSLIFNPEFDKKEKAPSRTIHKLDEYTGIGNLLTSPITALYYSFSVKAQRRLWAMEKLEKRKIADLKYNREFIALILNTEDENTISETRRHCNFDEDFIIESSFYELGVAIRNCRNSLLISTETNTKKFSIDQESDYDDY